MPLKFVSICFLLFGLLLAACLPQGGTESVRITGQTMGTTYNVFIVGGDNSLDERLLHEQVENVLVDVNSKMSNWDSESEISRFNKLTGAAPFKVSDDLLEVMVEASKVHTKSKGKFDVTLGPLIDLWGFGARKPDTPVPADENISEALDHVGLRKVLSLDVATKTLSKSVPEVQVNLSALAKGFGIDAVAAKLIELGHENFMVEIGGDLRTSGKNEREAVWRVGIEKPEADLREVKKIVAVSGKGMATSGDYRNFVEVNGKRFSHILDPSTGRPIEHLTTSVTVIADSAMSADAWATALLVLGAEQGLKIANEYDLAAYFISRDRDLGEQQYVIATSNAFEKFTKTH